MTAGSDDEGSRSESDTPVTRSAKRRMTGHPIQEQMVQPLVAPEYPPAIPAASVFKTEEFEEIIKKIQSDTLRDEAGKIAGAAAGLVGAMGAVGRLHQEAEKAIAVPGVNEAKILRESAEIAELESKKDLERLLAEHTDLMLRAEEAKAAAAEAAAATERAKTQIDVLVRETKAETDRTNTLAGMAEAAGADPYKSEREVAFNIGTNLPNFDDFIESSAAEIKGRKEREMNALIAENDKIEEKLASIKLLVNEALAKKTAAQIAFAKADSSKTSTSIDRAVAEEEVEKKREELEAAKEEYSRAKDLLEITRRDAMGASDMETMKMLRTVLGNLINKVLGVLNGTGGRGERYGQLLFLVLENMPSAYMDQGKMRKAIAEKSPMVNERGELVTAMYNSTDEHLPDVLREALGNIDQWSVDGYGAMYSDVIDRLEALRSNVGKLILKSWEETYSGNPLTPRDSIQMRIALSINSRNLFYQAMLDVSTDNPGIAGDSVNDLLKTYREKRFGRFGVPAI